jgi:hypothetical protein
MKTKLWFIALLLVAVPAFGQAKHDSAEPLKNLYVDVPSAELGGGGQIVVISKQVINDFQCIPTPGNPSTGSVRLYCDSGTGNMACLNSSGLSCLPSGGAGNPAAPPFSVQVNNGGSFGGLALGSAGAPLISGGAGAFSSFTALNLAGGSAVVTGLLPHANIASTAVTPGSYTNTNITVAADGSITAAANGSGGGMTWPAGGAGIPNYNGSSAWGTSYSASNTIPANFISTLNQNTTGTAATITGALALANTPLTTAGDLLFANNTPALARLPIGSTNQVLTVISGLPSWQNASSGFSNPMTTLGDIIYENATPAAARLPGPTSPAGISQSFCSTPSGGLATAPAWCIPGVAIDAQSGTSFTIPITDDVHLVTGNNGAATAWTGFTLANNYSFAFENLGAGLITYTPASGTVNGSATQIIPQFWFGFHYTDNTITQMPVLPTIQAFPSCPDSAGNHLNFTTATGALSCGTTSVGPTLQTNTVNNGIQTILNFLTSTTNSIGGTITPSNSTSTEKFELTGTILPVGGGTGLSSPTAHSLLLAEGSSNFALVTSPSVNGSYLCGFNVTASAPVDLTCPLPGVPVDATNPATLLYSDRANYLNWTAGTALALPAVAGNFASNFPFVIKNTSTTLTITPNAGASDLIDSAASGTLIPNFAAFVYQDSTTAPGHWFTIKVPTFAAFGSTCGDSTHGLSWSTTTGFGCQSITGSAAAGGSNTQIQYNNSTALGGITNFTSNGTNPLLTAIAAPATPASGFDVLYEDSTDLRFHDKNASGTIGTTVVANTGSANNFVTAISAAGVISLAQPAFSNLTGSAICAQLPALVGDVTTPGASCTTTNVNLPDLVTQAGSILVTDIAAPASPAAAHLKLFGDSTDLRFHDKNAAGTIGTTVVSDTGASNNFLTAISAAGVISKSQPSFANLSGSATCAQLPALTGDTTTSAGSCATSTVKVNGAAVPASAFFLGSNGSNQLVADQPWIVNPQTSTYQVVAADFAGCKTITVASGTFTITLVASGSQPATGQCINVFNYGSGVVTIARSGQNINGAAANLTLNAGSASAPTSANIVSDGTNYFATLDEGTVGTVTSIATTGPITGGTITGSGTIACATCVTSAASLSSGQLMAGAGGQASQVSNLSGDVTTSGSLATLVKQAHWTDTAITNASSPYTVLAADTIITCDATAGAVVINLPAATATGRQITFKKIDSTANACTPTRAGSDLIDGATSFGMTVQYAAATVIDTASAVWSRTHVNQLFGDVTGASTANTVVQVNGAVVPASANVLSTNASKQLVASTGHNISVPLDCSAASGSGTAYTCSTVPTFAPADGDAILFEADVANTGAATLNVNSSSAAPIKKQGGGTALVANDMLAGQDVFLIFDGTNWQMQGQVGNAAGGGTPCTTTALSLQYNNGGAFGCLAEFTYASSTITSSAAGKIDLSATTGASAFRTQVLAGAAPALNGAIAYDSTNNMFHGGLNSADSKFASFTATPAANNNCVKWVVSGSNFLLGDAGAACLGGISSVVSVTPVTAAAAVSTDQQLMELSLPAGFLNTLKQPFWFNAAGVYSTAATQTPTLTFKIKLCIISGCGSGTVVTLTNIVTTATLASVTNNNWNLNILGATAATGATGNLEAHGHLSVDLGATLATADSIFNDVTTAVSANIDLTAALFVDFTVAESTASTTVTITERIGAVMPQSNPTGAGAASTSMALGSGSGTAGQLACVTASNTQGNCTALPPNNFLGVFLPGGTSYATTGIVSVVIDATQNVTFGDILCASTIAGKSHDNGTTSCASGEGVGTVTTTASSVSTVTASLRLQ